MIDIINILYLAFRLSPFIVVSFFTLQSILNQDLKGLIYLVGLLVSTFFTVSVSKFVPIPSTGETGPPNPECNVITIGANGDFLSKLPLSTGVFSFTFIYLLIMIINTARNVNTAGIITPQYFTAAALSTAFIENIPVMIIFPLLLIIDVLWIMSYKCSSIISIIASFLINGFMGFSWAMIVIAINNPDLFYITGNSADRCNRPRTSVFRCRVA